MEAKSEVKRPLTQLIAGLKKKETGILRVMWITFGMIAPAPVLSFHGITLFTWGVLLIGMISVIRLLKCGELHFSALFDREYLTYITFVLLSYGICAIRMPKTWNSDLLKSLVQVSCLGFTCLFLQSEERIDEVRAFILGIYLSAVIQMIWGLLQYCLYQFGFDLNNFVFVKILHLLDGGATQLDGYGGIKMSGFCWNSGNFAPILIIGYWMARKKPVKLLFVITAFLSGSRTLMFGMAFCVLLTFIVWFAKDRDADRSTLICIAAAFAVSILFFFWKRELVVAKLADLSKYLNVVQNYTAEGSTNAHLNYLFSIPQITKSNSLLTNLLGYGPGCSGYAISRFSGQYISLGAWTIECDYVNTLWSYGYIGFIAYYYWYFRTMSEGRRINAYYVVLYGTFLLMGFMYNVTFFWVTYFLLFLRMMNKSGIDLLSEGMEPGRIA